MFGHVRIVVTVSIGLAAMPADGAHFDALMSAADRALYSAKLSGRNQTRTEDTASSRLVPARASGLAY
jgi:diguanylate cyclase (GGDEF)-like protein